MRISQMATIPGTPGHQDMMMKPSSNHRLADHGSEMIGTERNQINQVDVYMFF